MKNELLKVVKVIGKRKGYLMGGEIIIENILGWNGVGKLMIIGIE